MGNNSTVLVNIHSAQKVKLKLSESNNLITLFIIHVNTLIGFINRTDFNPIVSM